MGCTPNDASRESPHLSLMWSSFQGTGVFQLRQETSSIFLNWGIPLLQLSKYLQ